MTIREQIEQISDREIAEALLQSDSEENNDMFGQCRRIVEAYGFGWNNTTREDDCEIFKDFMARFVRVVAMYGLTEIAEMQQREKAEKLLAKLKEATELEEAVKLQLALSVAFDIALFFTSLGQTAKIPQERLISLAEKIVERVRNA